MNVLGTLRTPWLVPIVLARADALGLMIIVGGLTLLIFSARAFNPIFGAFRMNRTSDDYMARVATVWSFTAQWRQPIFAAAGGVITTIIGLRPAIGCAAVLLLASATLLPWHPVHEEFPTSMTQKAARVDFRVGRRDI